MKKHLKSIAHKKTNDKKFKISPLVQSLWGSVKPLSKTTDYKIILADELAKEYLTPLSENQKESQKSASKKS